MIVKHSNLKNKQKGPNFLYRFVFSSSVSSFAVFLLLISFCLQPIERAYASPHENLEASPLTSNDAIKEPAVDESDFAVALEGKEVIMPDETISHNTQEVDSSVESSTSDNNSRNSENSEFSSTTEEVILNTISASSTSSSTDAVEDEVDSVETSPPPKNYDTNPATTSSSTLDIGQATTTTASNTAPVGETLVSISTSLSDSELQFKKNDCITVSDGSFYCQPKVQKQKDSSEEGFYSLPDVDGDLEIYLKKDGNLHQITYNQVDDSATFYDSQSNTLVWHRQVDDRFQIMSYDLDKNEEIQLTTGVENNMEPTRSGNNTVWQRWNKSNWDIVLYDGKEVRFLSTDPQQDIAPKIKGSLVMWNRLIPTGGQTIELYDISTNEYTTINDNEGGAVSNPRMVLVYESEFDNGDVVTKGYDVFSGKIIPLAAKPVDLPAKIPSPDNSGETKALLQPNNSIKEEQEALNNIVPKSSPGSETDLESNGTTTLNMASTSTTLIATSSVKTVVEPDLPIESQELFQAQYDLYIPSFDATSSTSTEDKNGV